jgi:hypothetical protein
MIINYQCVILDDLFFNWMKNWELTDYRIINKCCVDSVRIPSAIVGT